MTLILEVRQETLSFCKIQRTIVHFKIYFTFISKSCNTYHMEDLKNTFNFKLVEDSNKKNKIYHLTHK